jgi:hypothetical protein
VGGGESLGSVACLLACGQPTSSALVCGQLHLSTAETVLQHWPAGCMPETQQDSLACGQRTAGPHSGASQTSTVSGCVCDT